MTTPCNLLGLGNVLLDLVLPVTDEEFAKLHLPVPRGQVLRIATTEQTALLSQFPKERIMRSAGGSCANALRTFAWHGMSAKLLGLAGDDEPAEFLANAFRDAGVETSGIKRLSGHSTDCCLALVTPDGERTMLPAFDAGAQASKNIFRHIDLEGFNYIHIEGYNLRFPTMLDSVLELAHSLHLKLSWDLGDVSLVQSYRNELQALFHANPLTCLFANRSEAEEFTGYAPAEASVALTQFAECAIVTAGGEGAWVARRGEAPCHIPAVQPLSFVDTIGAGDSFEGSFLASYYSGATPVEAARHAAAFAAQVIALPGATMPEKGKK
ncbi:MAG: hypothetical protein IKR13_02875 [Victivallales bacterium]|nr:hypothetical protein [Victivallales bacterium]